MNARMRIGIDCRALQEPQPSGVSVYSLHLLRAVLQHPKSEAHTYVLFFNAWTFRSAAAREEMQRLVLDGIEEVAGIEWRFSRIPSKLFTLLTVAFQRPSVERLFGNIDLLFLPNIDFLAPASSDVPLLLTIHDMSWLRYGNLLPLKERLRYWLLRTHTVIHSAKYIIPVSMNTLRDVQQLENVSQERMEVVYPGIDHIPEQRARRNDEGQRVIPNGGVNPVELPFRPEHPSVIAIGASQQRKNLIALVQAFATVRQRIPQAQLVIIGNVHPRWEEAAELEQWKTQGILFVDYVDEQTKSEIVQHATVCVYPSLYEGFGFPPLEAQRVGVPVIVSSTSSLPEVVDNAALLVDSTDVRSLARALESLLSDAVLHEHLRDRGFVNARRFTWERAAGEWLGAVTQAVKAGKRTPKEVQE